MTESKFSNEKNHRFSFFAQNKINKANSTNTESISALTGLNGDILGLIFDYVMEDYNPALSTSKYRGKLQQSNDDLLYGRSRSWGVVNYEQYRQARDHLSGLIEKLENSEPTISINKPENNSNYKLIYDADKKQWQLLYGNSKTYSAINPLPFELETLLTNKSPEDLISADEQNIKEIIKDHHRLVVSRERANFLKKEMDEFKIIRNLSPSPHIVEEAILLIFDYCASAFICYLGSAWAFSHEILGGFDRAFIVNQDLSFFQFNDNFGTSFLIGLIGAVIPATIFGSLVLLLKPSTFCFLPRDHSVSNELDKVISNLGALQTELDEYNSAMSKTASP
jgi:hypothetical protein